MKQRIEELENEKSNQTDLTNSINNVTNIHNTDINLINNKLGSTDISSIGNGTIIGAIKDLKSGPITEGTVSISNGGANQNIVKKNSLFANIYLYIILSSTLNVGDVFATLPEGYHPPYDCYISGSALHEGTWYPIVIKIKPDGTISQEFWDNINTQIMVYGTYPVS